MKDLFTLRDKASGKYFRKQPTIGGTMAVCDAVLENINHVGNLFFFDSPEQAFLWLRTIGKPLPLATEVVPITLMIKPPVKLVEMPEESYWDEPTALALLNNTPVGKCELCGRESYSLMEVGEACGKTLTDGSCPGVVK